MINDFTVRPGRLVEAQYSKGSTLAYILIH